MRRGILAVAALAAMALLPAAPSGAAAAERPDGPITIIMVRHGEKADVAGDDPPLSPAGRRRAEDLAALLRDAGVTRIVVSGFRRTQETARPIAERLGIVPEVVGRTERESDHVRMLAATVRRLLPGPILVVGHTNTIPDLIAALNGPRFPEICDAVYDNLFVLYEGEGRTRLLRARYGAPTPEDVPACH